MTTSSYLKDPNAVLDYQIDWSTWLAEGDTITGAPTWTITGPDELLLEDSSSNTTTTATVWLSGGTLDSDYKVTCHITTVQGRQEDCTLSFAIRSR